MRYILLILLITQCSLIKKKDKDEPDMIYKNIEIYFSPDERRLRKIFGDEIQSKSCVCKGGKTPTDEWKITTFLDKEEKTLMKHYDCKFSDGYSDKFTIRIRNPQDKYLVDEKNLQFSEDGIITYYPVKNCSLWIRPRKLTNLYMMGRKFTFKKKSHISDFNELYIHIADKLKVSEYCDL